MSEEIKVSGPFDGGLSMRMSFRFFYYCSADVIGVKIGELRRAFIYT